MSQPTPGSARAPIKSTPTATATATAPATATATPTGSTAAPVHVQEFTVRIPKNLKKMHHVMRFNATLKVDFAKWKNVKMERENNMRDARPMEEEMPKFGAGSEYNRDLKEELRRKKFGFQPRKYKQDAQPWILKVGGKSGQKFRGIRDGGVSSYASFYVFAHAPDGAIEAYPLNEWYNFQPVQRYKALSAEQAEEEYGRRNRSLNYFSLMMRNRLKGDDEGQDDPEEAKLKLTGKKSKDLKISDADELMSDSDDGSDSENETKKNEDDSDTDSKKKKGKKGTAVKKKKKKQGSDDEAFEESDDGDEEGREMDYIESSDSDDSDPELQVDKEMKSVAEEDGLRKLLTSDEESEEEKNTSDESNKEDEKNKKEMKENAKEKKKIKPKKSKDGEKKDSLSDFSSDSSDSEAETKKPRKLNGNSANNSRSASPSLDLLGAGSSGLKRKLPTDLGAGGNSNGASENSNSPNVTPAKKTKYDAPAVSTSFAGVISGSRDDNGITEEAVRRYLMRKPMTTTELLTKFKNKKTGVSSEKLVETMTQILKKINPVKQTIQGKMYLSIKNK